MNYRNIIVVILFWLLTGIIGSGISQHDFIHVTGNNIAQFFEENYPKIPMRDKFALQDRNFNQFEEKYCYGRNVYSYYLTMFLGPINLLAAVINHYHMPYAIANSLRISPVTNLDWGWAAQWPFPRFSLHSN